MASIGFNPAVTGDTSSTAPASNAKTDPTASKEQFLQLLVAQIKNQNPLDPADGVQFLSQLAQFSELEQMVGIRAELTTLNEKVQRVDSDPATGTTDQEQ